MSDIPRKPTGHSDQARHARWVHDKLANQSQLARVSGHRVMNTTRGPVMVPSRSTFGSGTGKVTSYKLRLVYDDYLVARDFDGTNLGADDVLIAKPHILRCSPASEQTYVTGSWQTVSYTYADDLDEPFMVITDGGGDWGEQASDYESGGDLFEFRLNTIRTSTISPDSEDAQVVPIYLKGQVIYAVESDYTGVTVSGVELDLIEVSPARHWAAIG